ncbi:14 kDa proline-rich protein DC2.15-like [Cornus florida]|uniref:14 kDa proline-rich protein DC2.15-like n=1 Tax=Cornus florida TaxID=4283 RepID=UPI002899C763|nr:14 kDa proline-rich protein DC2.15-like [Cornus florida]
MITNKLSVAILIFSLLFSSAFSTFSTDCIPCMPKPKPKPMPPPKAPPVNPFCPRDTLKLGACVDLLGGLVNIVVGSPPSSKCCALLEGLADLEAAACLCTAIKANVLGINLNVPVTLSLLLSACEKSIPPGFQCG